VSSSWRELAAAGARRLHVSELDCRMLGSRRPAVVSVCLSANQWCSPPSCANFVVVARQRWLHRLAVRAANRPVVFLDCQVGCSPSPGFWCDLQASGKILHAGGSVVERASPCPQPSACVAASSLRPLTYHSASRPGLARDTQTGELWHLRVFF
jgi:hypothetical protein